MEACKKGKGSLMKKISNRIVALVVLVSVSLFAQSAVRGKLELGEEKLPASGIAVTLLHAEKGRSAPALSGADGMFFLYNVEVGDYTLEVWNKGLKNDSLTLKVSVTPQSMNKFVDVPIIRIEKPVPPPVQKK